MQQEKKDYSQTVLTPKTDFPMKANLAQREPERLKKWEAEKLYQKMQERRVGRPTYILHDGPPYANGDIHLGTSMNKILKDVIVRYKTLKGFRAPYVPGWDCHGLPIEQHVSKKLGPKINQMEPVAVRKLCQEYATKYLGIQRTQFKRLGVSGDWEKPYCTFDPQYEVGILSCLRDLVAKGLVRKGLKPVHWDPVFRTALAEAEIEYAPHESDSIYVRFPLRHPEKYPSLKGLDEVSLVIWTTTPWTLPANLAVCLHPDFEYVVVRGDRLLKEGPAGQEYGRGHFIVAKELAESFVKVCAILNSEIVATFKARELERAECDHPNFPDKSSLVILGKHVTLDAGTGCVHTAPGHGMEDYIVGGQYGLPIFVPVDDAGKFSADYPEMKGVSVFDANSKIVEKLRDAGLLLAAGKITHEYPHSWRSHKPIIFRATEQWFMELTVGNVRENALRAIDNEVQWFPSWGRDRIHGMVSQRPDWCLSRQRSWGVPIPSVRSKKTGKSVLDVRIIDAFIKVVAEKGTDAWFTEPLASFWPEGFRHEETGESRAEDFEKEFDILDVWFDSGASHVAVLEKDPRLAPPPADLYLEGTDQHRGWFQSSLLTSIGARGRAPYRGVLTHGFVLDSQGKAMSKSAGNVISPLEVSDKLGADILRLWVCSEDYRTDVRVSNEILSHIAESYRRIRNTFRYVTGNLYDFDPKVHAVEYKDMEEIDRWILGQLAGLIERVTEAYDAFQFHKVYHWVHGMCTTQFSAIYFDVVKDRLYCSAPNDRTRRSVQTALYAILGAISRIMAPILVFTADEAWEFGKLGERSVHLADFPVANPEWRNPDLEQKWDRLLELRDAASLALEESRRGKAIGHSLDANLEIEVFDGADYDFLTENLALLKSLFIVSDVRIGPPAEKGEVGPDGGSIRRIRVIPADAAKCDRCWMKLRSVGRNAEHPGLCERCADVIQRIEV